METYKAPLDDLPFLASCGMQEAIPTVNSRLLNFTNHARQNGDHPTFWEGVPSPLAHTSLPRMQAPCTHGGPGAVVRAASVHLIWEVQGDPWIHAF